MSRLKNRFEKIAVDQEICMHCGACVGTCPENAMFLHDLTVSADENCNGCGYCVRVCPIGAIERVKRGAAQ
ncbi:MAG: 4Fe-4S binding protein [Thermoplasmata archaeon]|nr:4Fe-4S binding protein [Thermoplasmata archaeon]